jgi:ribosome-associated translation inhibitor RaiA
MPLDDILTKLGLDPSDFATTDEKLTALEGSLEKLGSADPAEITPEVDLVGVNDRLEKVKEYLANVDKPDATPTMDQDAVKKSVDKAKETIDNGLTKSSVDVTLNAEESIGKIREQLKEEIDLGIQSAKGTEYLSNIDYLVTKIEGFVKKIEGKLPMQALA